MSRPLRLPVIAGVTASGKTALAVALAKRLNGEVVSADSMQIYADLSVGTARPTEAEMGGVAHHLIGFLPMSEAYSVARYLKDARAAIGDVTARGKLPILCGGTGLYLQSLLDGLQLDDTEPDAALRRELRARAEREGGAVLLRELAACDPVTAARLHENDLHRITRALEAYQTTGIPLSEQERLSRQTPSDYDGCLIVLTARDRQVLYDRIDRRVDAMMQNGLLEEARTVMESPAAHTVLQAIGYKELFPFLRGEQTREEAADTLKCATRHYAKRQLSWFRRMDDAHFLYIDDYPAADDLTEAALAIWNGETP